MIQDLTKQPCQTKRCLWCHFPWDNQSLQFMYAHTDSNKTDDRAECGQKISIAVKDDVTVSVIKTGNKEGCLQASMHH